MGLPVCFHRRWNIGGISTCNTREPRPYHGRQHRELSLDAQTHTRCAGGRTGKKCNKHTSYTVLAIDGKAKHEWHTIVSQRAVCPPFSLCRVRSRAEYMCMSVGTFFHEVFCVVCAGAVHMHGFGQPNEKILLSRSLRIIIKA